MRETAALKAERLLTSGRVVIVRADGRHIRAIVRGDTEGFHTVEHVDGRWICSCSHAPYGSCSHKRAVMLVTVPVQPVVSIEAASLTDRGTWHSLGELLREQAEREASDDATGRFERLAELAAQPPSETPEASEDER